MNNDVEKLIYKKLLGSISDEEDKLLAGWMKADWRHRKHFEAKRQDWIQRTEEAPEFMSEKPAVHSGGPLSRKRTLGVNVAEGVAIGLMVIATLLTYDGIKDRPSVFHAGTRIHSFWLEDSTRVTLRPGSVLLISSGYGNDDRRVELEGQAYFEVRQDSLKPFVVMSKFSRIQVLGTSFMLHFDPEHSIDEVEVLSGKVRLSSVADPENEVVVVPGKKGVLNRKNLAIALQQTDTANTLAWKDRELVFEKTPLEDVARVVGDYFGIAIKIDNPELLSCPVTRTFVDPTVDDVVESLRNTMGIVIVREYQGITVKGDGCR